MLAERVTEWTEQWEQQGIEKGILKCEAIFLVRLLERRFGTLDETSRVRILQADSETLLQWGDQVLTATTLAEVFRT